MYEDLVKTTKVYSQHHLAHKPHNQTFKPKIKPKISLLLNLRPFKWFSDWTKVSESKDLDGRRIEQKRVYRHEGFECFWTWNLCFWLHWTKPIINIIFFSIFILNFRYTFFLFGSKPGFIETFITQNFLRKIIIKKITFFLVFCVCRNWRSYAILVKD